MVDACVLCPSCESDEPRAVNPSLARCSGCEDMTLSRSFFDTSLLIGHYGHCLLSLTPRGAGWLCASR
jgi:hypothetical protein